MRHNKIKNSAIVFELLLRKLTSDTINGNENSPCLSIIKEFFNKNTVLGKEYQLYQILVQNKFSSETKANSLLEEVLRSRKTLNERQLRKEKYEIIKKIRENYDLESFFNTKLDNYKLYASVYKLFENDGQVSPLQIFKEKSVIIEHIVNDKKTTSNSESILEQFEKENKDVRLIAYKILVDKFNKKYSSKLDKNQKSLLREYIYNASNSIKLLEYIKNKIPLISGQIQKFIDTVDDKVIKIKLHETLTLLDKFNTIKFVKDEHVLSLLRYYELIKECKILKQD